MKDIIRDVIEQAGTMVQAMQTDEFLTAIHTVGEAMKKAGETKHTVFIGGNGGSWNDVDHFAGELRAQFEVKGRPAVPAVAVPVSLSSLTAWGNDYDDGFEAAIERDLEALAKTNDIFIAISTSGKARNLRRALSWANAHGLQTIAISGNGPQSSEFGAMADHHIMIPHSQTARIQEGYQIIIHALCMYVDQIKETHE